MRTISSETKGCFLSRSKNLTPDEDYYFSIMINQYGLGKKIITILMTVKRIFYSNTPDDRVTLDMLYSACDYLLHDTDAKAYITFGNQIPLTGIIPTVQYQQQTEPSPNSNDIEEIEPDVNGADYSRLSKEELSQFFEM